MNLFAARPSPAAARTALIASVLALLAMLLFPYATVIRQFDGSATLLQLFGGLVHFTDFPPRDPPNFAGVTALGWATFAGLALSAVLAARRLPGLWAVGAVTLLLAALAIVRLEGTLAAASAALDAAGVPFRQQPPYEAGGLHLGMFAPLVGSLGVLLAGLSPLLGGRMESLRALMVPLVSVVLALLAGTVLLMLLVEPRVADGVNPGAFGSFLAYADLGWLLNATLFSPVTTLGGLVESLKFTTPLIFVGLAVGFAFRAGLFNIGAPGQLTMGAIFAMLVGVYAPLPGLLLLIAAVTAAALGGALWGGIPGALKARFGASEVVITIMLNYIASGILVFMLGGNNFTLFGREYPLPFRDEGFEARSFEIQEAARLPGLPALFGLSEIGPAVLSLGPVFGILAALLVWKLLRHRFSALFGVLAGVIVAALSWGVGVPTEISGAVANSRWNASFLIALLAAAVFGTVMWRMALGYGIRAVGLSPKAAEYGGVAVGRTTVITMMIAGAFAGLAATHYVLGGALEQYRLLLLPASVGFTGIVVALVGGSAPVGIVLAALLFGVLDAGSVLVDSQLGVSRDLLFVLQALIVFFIAVKGFLDRRHLERPLPQLPGPGGQPNLAAAGPAATSAPGVAAELGERGVGSGGGPYESPAADHNANERKER